MFQMHSMFLGCLTMQILYYKQCSTKPYTHNLFNPFKPEFTIVIFIHYKPPIAVAILDL